jgi:uncharacterized membrane protein YqjE
MLNYWSSDPSVQWITVVALMVIIVSAMVILQVRRAFDSDALRAKNETLERENYALRRLTAIEVKPNA